MTSRDRSVGRSAGVVGVGLVLLTASCSSVRAEATATVASPSVINHATIPLGDDHVSSTPKVGYVDSCQTSFPPVGGASQVGPWINTAAKTWNANTKIHVQGKEPGPRPTRSCSRRSVPGTSGGILG